MIAVMSDTNWLAIGLGALLAVSVLLNIILIAACASGKREDDAAAQLSDAQCGANWGNEIAEHGQTNRTGAQPDNV
jgi:hypothetical protein